MRTVGRWRGPSGPPVPVWDLIRTDLISLFLLGISGRPWDRGLPVGRALEVDTCERPEAWKGAARGALATSHLLSRAWVQILVQPQESTQSQRASCLLQP